MSFSLHNFPLALIFGFSFVVLIALCEIGRQVGKRVGKGGIGNNLSTIEGAILGLLALMLGFTFSMAMSRYEDRRVAILQEANAIGTTALRARLLPAPHKSEMLKLLREYIQIRIDITTHNATLAEIKPAIDRSNALQESMWLQAKAIAAADNSMVPTGIFIQSLNEMIDDQTTRLAAANNVVPDLVLVALFSIAGVSSAFAGYVSGATARRSHLPVYLLSMLVSGVILLIVDLDRPGNGFIIVSQQPILDVAASMTSFTTEEGR